MKTPDTLRARLTAWYVLAVALTLTAFAVLMYAWLSRSLSRHHDHELLATADRVAQLLRTVPLDDPSVAAAVGGVEGGPRLLMVRDRSGELIYRSPLLAFSEPTIGHHEALMHAAMAGSTAPEFFTVALERSGLVRFICAPIQRTPAAYVQVGNPLGDVPATMHTIAVASVTLIPFVVVLTSFGGWLIAKRALAPIDGIDSTLRSIEATDLSRRVEVHPADRDLSGLVQTINGLLARLEGAFKDLRDFTADASHQLQTPLTIMKSTIELARRSRSEIAPTVLDDLEEEITDMSTVVSELQSLSLADADAQGAREAHVDLSVLCEDAAEILMALGESHGVAVEADVSRRVCVAGNAQKLKQMILNLGDNAIKYTPAGGRITIRLGSDANTAVLEVADTGIGISQSDLPRVFDRFYRVSSPAPTTSGHGLGLTIAKRIVDIHDGTIGVSSTPGHGTRFTVTLPRVHG